MKTYFYILFIALFFTGCLDDEKLDTLVKIKINMPEGFSHFSAAGINVKVYNTSGLSYTATCDAEGVATLNVEYGFYDAVAQSRQKENNVIHIFNGSISNIILSPGTASGSDNMYTITLSHAQLQQLIIKEIYYGGCKTDEGKNYNSKDQYISIYNNSDEVVYLDSICIGVVQPPAPTGTNYFKKPDGSLMDELGVIYMAWQFPGSGTDTPLQPGEEAVLAQNAVNHEARYSQSVDLSKIRFALWHPDLTMQEAPTPGVTPLSLIWKGSSMKLFMIGNVGPSVILFKLPENATTYASNADNIIKTNPITQKGQDCLKVMKDWVIDGIECFKYGTGEGNKHLTDNIDAGYIYLPENNAGLSVQRKVESVAENGRIIYMDTNNSTNDMEVVRASLKNK